MAPPLRQLHIPDFFSFFNFPSNLNPHEDDIRAESEEWVFSLCAFTESQRSQLLASDIPRFASRTYPYASYEKFRICCDYSLLVFAIDEITDDEDLKQGPVTCTLVGAMGGDAPPSLRNNLIEDYRSRLSELVGPTLWRRMLNDWDTAYLCFQRELQIRESKEILSIEEYTSLRRETIGARLAFSHVEYALGIELLDEVYENTVFIEIYLAAVDMIWLSNDVCSYEKEFVKGHGACNFLSIIMHEHSVDIQGAVDYSGVKFREIFDRFMAGKAHLPSWGEPLDSDIAAFVDALGIWVVGYLHWTFETPRYFGPWYEEVKRTCVVRIGNLENKKSWYKRDRKSVV